MVRTAPSRASTRSPADAPHGSAIVVRTGEPELVTKVTDDVLFAAARDHEHLDELRELGLTSLLTRPADRARGRARRDHAAQHDPRATAPEELEIASELARRTASAIETERAAERYRMLFEASPLPMWVYDAETLAFLAVNDAAIRHYGYRRDEFLAMTIRDIRPPEDVAGAARRHQPRRRTRLVPPRHLAPPDQGRAAGSTSRSRPGGSTSTAAAPRSCWPTTSPTACGCEERLARPRRWRRSGASRAASRTTSTTC